MTYTKGPWSVFQRDNTFAVEPRAKATGRRPCIIDWPGFDSNDQPQATNEANAHLIAAAPDLLEALERLAEEDPDLPKYVHAAIAKAKGEGV